MGYHITLSRRGTSPGITAQEWRDFVTERPELKIVEENEHFITTVLDGDDSLILHHSSGADAVFASSPDGPQIIEYLASIAPIFGGVVTGDEGEVYTNESDWGTQADWDAQASIRSAPQPWRRRELSRGKRLVVGLLLGVLIFLIREVFY
ncbi:MAG: hypothetical protein ACON4R_00075 [Akkermansiaceae bacterium]